MRDGWVNRMVESTRIGVEDSSLESVVRGLRELLGILEAIKLVSFLKCIMYNHLLY
jgi:hypothetical protein